MIKAVLFDVDGILYDSMPLHAKSWQQAFKKVGLKLPAKLVYYIEGMPDQQAAESMLRRLGKKLPDKTIEEIIKTKIKLFNSYPKPKLIPGAKQFIRDLKKLKIKICLVTGSSQTKTLKRLKKDFGIDKNNIITGKEVRRGKPYPDPYLKALRRLRVKPSEAIVIENAPLGVESAKRAKIKCIALSTGIVPKAELKRRGADVVLNSYAEINAHLAPIFHFYILLCKDGTLYCGSTNNLENRLKLHNGGKGSIYVRTHGGGKIVYSESYETKGAAMRREIQVKKWPRRKKHDLINGLVS
jgi:HAD superfamily hydrolase (TIGR01509 family)